MLVIILSIATSRRSSCFFWQHLTCSIIGMNNVWQTFVSAKQTTNQFVFGRFFSVRKSAGSAKAAAKISARSAKRTEGFQVEKTEISKDNQYQPNYAVYSKDHHTDVYYVSSETMLFNKRATPIAFQKDSRCWTSVTPLLLCACHKQGESDTEIKGKKLNSFEVGILKPESFFKIQDLCFLGSYQQSCPFGKYTSLTFALIILILGQASRASSSAWGGESSDPEGLGGKKVLEDQTCD